MTRIVNLCHDSDMRTVVLTTAFAAALTAATGPRLLAQATREKPASRLHNSDDARLRRSGPVTGIRARHGVQTDWGTATAVQVWATRSAQNDAPGTIFLTSHHVVEDGLNGIQVAWNGGWHAGRMVECWTQENLDLSLIYVPGVLATKVYPVSSVPVESGDSVTIHAYVHFVNPQTRRTEARPSRKDAVITSMNKSGFWVNQNMTDHSGGAVLKNGEVVGVVFGQSTEDRTQGYADQVTKVYEYLHAYDPRCGCPVRQPPTEPQAVTRPRRAPATRQCRCDELKARVQVLQTRLNKLIEELDRHGDIPDRVADLEARQPEKGDPGPRGPAGPRGEKGETVFAGFKEVPVPRQIYVDYGMGSGPELQAASEYDPILLGPVHMQILDGDETFEQRRKLGGRPLKLQVKGLLQADQP